MKLITETIEETNVISEGNGVDKQYFIEGPFMTFDIKNQNGRVYPKNVLLREMANYNEKFVTKNRSLGELGHPNCFRDDAMLMSESGIKLIKDVIPGELVYSFNVDNNKVELVPVLNVINEYYDGDMYHINGRSIDTLVTPNHEFLIRDRYGKYSKITAKELSEKLPSKQYSHHSIPTSCDNMYIKQIEEIEENIVLSGDTLKHLKNNPNLKEKYEKPIEINKYVWAAFLGVFLSEGWVQKKTKNNKQNYKINIYQNAGEKADKIQLIFDNMPKEVTINKYINNNKITWSISDYRIWKELNKLGNSYQKYIEQKYFSQDSKFLEILLDHHTLGDGRKYKGTSKHDVFSVSKKMMEDYAHVCFLLKKAFTIHTRKPKDVLINKRLIRKENCKDLYFVEIKTSNNVWLDPRFLTITKQQYKGNVVCIQNKNQNFYALHKITNNRLSGFWTGNSAAVNLDRVSHIIKKLWAEDKHIYGRAKVMDTPFGKIVKNFIDEGAKLGVSSRGVGTVDNKGGQNIIQDDYRLITVDIVADPSAPEAFVNGILEGREFVYLDNGIISEKTLDAYKSSIKAAESRKQLEEKMLGVFSDFLSKLRQV